MSLKFKTKNRLSTSVFIVSTIFKIWKIKLFYFWCNQEETRPNRSHKFATLLKYQMLLILLFFHILANILLYMCSLSFFLRVISSENRAMTRSWKSGKERKMSSFFGLALWLCSELLFRKVRCTFPTCCSLVLPRQKLLTKTPPLWRHRVKRLRVYVHILYFQ